MSDKPCPICGGEAILSKWSRGKRLKCVKCKEWSTRCTCTGNKFPPKKKPRQFKKFRRIKKKQLVIADAHSKALHKFMSSIDELVSLRVDSVLRNTRLSLTEEDHK